MVRVSGAKLHRLAWSSGVSLLIIGTVPAAAQVTPDQSITAPSEAGAVQVEPVSSDPGSVGSSAGEDIVVTGTLLRGVAPVGTNVIGIGREDVIASGATNANQLLAEIPQVTSSFNRNPLAGGDIGSAIVRPNIRNLGLAGGSNTTLVLQNGHRLVSVGVIQTAVDPSVIPTIAIGRVEVVPDGGSSIYGSDAIGGVINFITRRRFDGLETRGTVGLGRNYREYTGSAILGRDWGSGSIYVAYEYNDRDAVFGRDRGYISTDLTSRGGSDFRSRLCDPGNVVVAGVGYGLPGRTPGFNLCDRSDAASLFPDQRRHSVFASMMQQLNETIRFDGEAYWSEQVTQGYLSQIGTTGAITASNPYFRPIGAETTQTVQFAYDRAFGPNRPTRSRLDAWGVTPAFTVDLGRGLELRAQGNYGRSFSQARTRQVNTVAEAAALAGTTAATALNPYDPGSSSPALLANIYNFENYGDAVQELAEGRLVLNGSLIDLPGGGLRVAVGGEYHHESYVSRTSTGAIGFGETRLRRGGSRNVESVFGEVLVPIFGPENGFAGMRRLELSGSVRYDHYSDQGGTTNPKVGLTYKPIEALTLRGNYGTSFNAPSLGDLFASDTRAQILPVSPYRAPGSGNTDLFRRTIVLAGGNPNLQSQTANTYSLGGDFKPAFVPGLTISATYYNVKFKNGISIAPVVTSTFFSLPAYAGFYTLNPTISQTRAAVDGLILDGAASVEALYAGTSPYVILDARRNNLSRVRTDGLDFNFAYATTTAFGSVNASVAGTWTLDRKSEPVAGAPVNDDLLYNPSLFLTATLGGSVGRLNARAQISYTEGNRLQNIPSQDRVRAFKPVDVFVAYNFGGEGVGKGLSLSLNVINVFDEDPPFLNQLSQNEAASGFGNGSTLGRVFQIGLAKKF